MSDATIDLRTAAQLLGVHYQTAYKWVRSGRLPGSLVRGRYRLSPDAVAELARRRERPAAPRARRPRHGYGPARERLFAALISGDDRVARGLIAGLIEDGVTLTSATQEVLVPALVRIGEDWSAGRLPVSVEHRASATAERILGEHHPAPRGRRRGTAVVTAIAGDRHALPTLMAAIALREDNWHVHHLGADVPAGDLADFCRRERVDLAVLTVSSGAAGRRARRAAADVQAGGVPAIVGMPGASLHDLQLQARDTRRRRDR